MTIVLTLIIIAILIFFHELGHFAAARRVGIQIYEFSLGFGYRLFYVKKGETEYSLRLIPLGGYVRMAGEEPGDMENPHGFNSRTPLEKLQVAIAGPLMNFVLAVLIFIYVFSLIGIAQPVNEAIIGGVLKDNPAYQAGLKSGDKILAVNDKNIASWNEFAQTIQNSPTGKPLKLKLSRGEGIKVLSVNTVLDKGTGKTSIGIYSVYTYDRQNILTSIKLGFVQTYQITSQLLISLSMLVTGEASTSDLAGPVGIASMVDIAARGGYLLAFTGLLSVNLGLLNLLPIPALDGSRIVFALIEAVRRKPMNPDKEGYIHWLGFVFLMLIMVFTTYNDIIRLFKG